MAVAESKKRTNLKWDLENTKVISVKLMLKRDSEIIEYWGKISNKADLFREIMLDYMEKHPIKE